MAKAVYEKINGEVFEVLKPSKHEAYCEGQLDSLYVRPSERKKAIMGYWFKWASGLPGCCYLWVSSHNSSFFSIGGRWEHDGNVYGIYITKTRQEVWRIV